MKGDAANQKNAGVGSPTPQTVRKTSRPQHLSCVRGSSAPSVALLESRFGPCIEAGALTSHLRALTWTRLLFRESGLGAQQTKKKKKKNRLAPQAYPGGLQSKYNAFQGVLEIQFTASSSVTADLLVRRWPREPRHRPDEGSTGCLFLFVCSWHPQRQTRLSRSQVPVPRFLWRTMVGSTNFAHPGHIKLAFVFEPSRCPALEASSSLCNSSTPHDLLGPSVCLQQGIVTAVLVYIPHQAYPAAAPMTPSRALPTTTIYVLRMALGRPVAAL